MPAQRKYPDELRERAVKMVLEIRARDGRGQGELARVGRQLGVHPEALRGWVKQAEVDNGTRPGTTTEDQMRIAELERENRELRRANEILRGGRADFARGIHPQPSALFGFIDSHRDRIGVEPVCAVLEFPVSTYYAVRKRERQPSAREVRDEHLKEQIMRAWEDRRKGRRVYGARKIWRQLSREGTVVARCTVERLMRELGIAGVAAQRKKPRTTVPAGADSRPADLLERDFTAPAPNRRWVADITYVAAACGFVYTAFVTDLFSRKIVGWQVADHLRAGLALDALEMALFARKDGITGELVLHSDRGVQGGFNRSSQHLDLEVCGWDGREGGRRLRRAGRRCGRRGARRGPGGSIGSGSGGRAGGGCRVRTRQWRLACRSRSGPGGSVRLAGWPRSPRPRCRGASCRSPSGRKSRSCTPGGAASARSRGVPPGHRQRSPGSCAGMRRPGAGRWSTGRRRRSGTLTGAPGGLRFPGSPRMTT